MLLFVLAFVWIRYDTRKRARLGLPSRKLNNLLALGILTIAVVIFASAAMVYYESVKHSNGYVEPIIIDGKLKEGYATD